MPQRLRPQPRPEPRRTRGPWHGHREAPTIPGEVVQAQAVDSAPTLLGFPADFAEPDDDLQAAIHPDEAPSDRELVVVRRADRLGGSALVLAGVAANASLPLSWSPGDGPSGLSLVEHGVRVLGSGMSESVVLSAWQPLVVVAAGGVLVLLGLLLLVPARGHRLVGVLALVASLAAAAAVVVLAADLGWRTDRFGPGTWCAVAVPVLGLIGSLKAMLTLPLVTLRDP